MHQTFVNKITPQNKTTWSLEIETEHNLGKFESEWPQFIGKKPNSTKNRYWCSALLVLARCPTTNDRPNLVVISMPVSATTSRTQAISSWFTAKFSAAVRPSEVSQRVRTNQNTPQSLVQGEQILHGDWCARVSHTTIMQGAEHVHTGEQIVVEVLPSLIFSKYIPLVLPQQGTGSREKGTGGLLSTNTARGQSNSRLFKYATLQEFSGFEICLKQRKWWSQQDERFNDSTMSLIQFLVAGHAPFLLNPSQTQQLDKYVDWKAGRRGGNGDSSCLNHFSPPVLNSYLVDGATPRRGCGENRRAWRSSTRTFHSCLGQRRPRHKCRKRHEMTFCLAKDALSKERNT